MVEQMLNPVTEAKRQAGIDHMLKAARRFVMANGLDATMDQLAEATGVSRRTLFRHFTSREKLLAAAFATGMDDYRHRLPDYDGDLDGWLRETCQAAHRMNAVIGPGFFELASRSDLPTDLADVEHRRRREFRDAMSDIARTAWAAAGHRGRPPKSFTGTVTAHLSPHFTAALVIDAGETWQTAAELAYAAIIAALEVPAL
ncbi:TetR/AcrR family transcriptional regulator [Mycolicibacterium arenosum]|uniref:TetR/AcrR family transcriptional regulator n=1 Tax=Mycolicibacterium arenosum TaxID=2952157 RepID=A0ABT1M5Z8_9MYCO|nr:TetR/AcrR family transcriptional regulator [Mycolicibacterium sp. CAU 1645]MCP9273659.1 TetR/AcrR family transcriptional regulator [Mycolicibacterium sp. CAU 1645]